MARVCKYIKDIREKMLQNSNFYSIENPKNEKGRERTKLACEDETEQSNCGGGGNMERWKEYYMELLGTKKEKCTDSEEEKLEKGKRNTKANG